MRVNRCQRAIIIAGLVGVLSSGCSYLVADPPSYDGDEEPDCRRTTAWYYLDVTFSSVGAAGTGAFTIEAIEDTEETFATHFAVVSGIVATAFAVSAIRDQVARRRCRRAQNRYRDAELPAEPSCDDWRARLAVEPDPPKRLRIIRELAPHCFP